MSVSMIFGFASAFGWAVSSYLWVRSTRVKLHQSPSTVYIEGRPSFNQNDLVKYINETGKINANAGAVSAASAAASAAALFLQSIGW